MNVYMVLRKIRSALIILVSEVRRLVVVSAFRFWFPGLTFGKKVQIGRGVRFRIYCGGRVRVGDGTSIGDFALIYAEGGLLSIGKDSFIGSGTEVVALERVTIGADALVASNCVIRDADHCFDDPSVPIRLQGQVVRPIEIGDDVWLGSHVVVTGGSSIGQGSVIGANAVVRGTIPPRSVAVGVPARVVRTRGALETSTVAVDPDRGSA